MEPRTHARGNGKFSAFASASGSSFNGATHSRAWKPIPRPWCPGKNKASMEPRTHARGNIRDLDLHYQPLRASMEPRTHARGNPLEEGFNLLCGIQLQWSHALRRVETPRPVAFNGGRLQRPALEASTEPRTHASRSGQLKGF